MANVWDIWEGLLRGGIVDPRVVAPPPARPPGGPPPLLPAPARVLYQATGGSRLGRSSTFRPRPAPTGARTTGGGMRPAPSRHSPVRGPATGPAAPQASSPPPRPGPGLPGSQLRSPAFPPPPAGAPTS